MRKRYHSITENNVTDSLFIAIIACKLNLTNLTLDYLFKYSLIKTGSKFKLN